MLYGSAVTALRVGWAVLAGASGAAGAAVGELLLFHVRLRCLGLSTYEFVLRQRARRGLPEGSSFEHSPETHATSNGVPRVALARPAHQRPPFWHAFKAGAEAHADPVLGQRDGHLDPAGEGSCAACGLSCGAVRTAAHGPYRAFHDGDAGEGRDSGACRTPTGAGGCAASCSGQSHRAQDVQGARMESTCSDVEPSRTRAQPSALQPSAGASSHCMMCQSCAAGR